MSQWSDSPPTEEEKYAHRIVRTPAATPLVGIITSTDLIGRPTHFANNRTIPCPGLDTCNFCADGFSKRWHGWFGLFITGTNEHAIMELTAKACDPLKNYALIHNSLRACGLKAHRPSKRPNGRVCLVLRPVDELRYRIPPPLDVKAILCHIWNVQDTDAVIGTGRGPLLKGIGLFDSQRDGRDRGNGDPDPHHPR